MYLIASSPARIENHLGLSLRRVCSRWHAIFYGNRTDLDAVMFTPAFKTRLKVQLIYILIGTLRDIGVRKLPFTFSFSFSPSFIQSEKNDRDSIVCENDR